MVRKAQAPVTKSQPEGLAKVPEAAAFLSLSRKTIYRMVEDGELAYVRVRDVIRIPWSALRKMAQSDA